MLLLILQLASVALLAVSTLTLLRFNYLLSSRYPSEYARLAPDTPAPTIETVKSWDKRNAYIREKKYLDLQDPELSRLGNRIRPLGFSLLICVVFYGGVRFWNAVSAA